MFFRCVLTPGFVRNLVVWRYSVRNISVMWDSLPNAQAYMVTWLGAFESDPPFLVTQTTNVTLSPLIPGVEYVISVVACLDVSCEGDIQLEPTIIRQTTCESISVVDKLFLCSSDHHVMGWILVCVT